MSEAGNIRYCSHKEIDKAKWDECITSSSNGLIYAYSFYLDSMAKHWDALVLNDYEAVMPLTYNKKYGIKYLYQPFLTAQLGIFGNALTETIIDSFIQAIPAAFKFIDISLNHNNISNQLTGLSVPRSNYVLDLNKEYATLYQAYKENIQRNIKKAQQANCRVHKDFDVEKVIELAVLQMKSQGQEEKENITHFRKLYHYLQSRNMATTYGIEDAEKELVASCVFFFSHQRAYYILVGNHPKGRNIGASHALIDAFIKEHAGKNLVLDFEGSDISNLALFYSGFGAVNEVYPALKINRLPFYLKWLKK